MPILDQTPGRDWREARLRVAIIAWFGSVRPDGRPHLVPVWFSWDGHRMVILSQPETQKVRNLRHNPRVTVALDDSNAGRDVVLFEGVATLAEQPSREAAPREYLEKYAGLLAEMAWPPGHYLADYSQVIVVTPTRFIEW
jgi:PPOX class probable F420-dependent enzyme